MGRITFERGSLSVGVTGFLGVISIFPDDLDLGFEFNSPGLADAGLNQLDQAQHVVRGRVAQVYEEIGVGVADHRVADPRSFEAHFVQQFAGGQRWMRVFKSAAGTGLSWLGGPALRIAGRHPLVDRRSISGSTL